MPNLADVPAARKAGVPSPDVEALLAQMTLDEKIGQMTQADKNALKDGKRDPRPVPGLGAVRRRFAPSPNDAATWANMYDIFQSPALATRLGIPLIYGVDAVHGHNNVKGATIFPHNIGLGATRNPALVQQSRASRRERSPAPASTGTSRPASASRATTAGAARTSPSARTPSWSPP